MEKFHGLDSNARKLEPYLERGQRLGASRLALPKIVGFFLPLGARL